MAFTSSPLLPANTDNEVAVRFWPGNWYKGLARGGRPQGVASREEIMATLDNIDQVLIRGQHVDGGPVDVTVTDIRMDTADIRDQGRGNNPYVEQCSCPAGYMGLSCQVS